MVDDWYSANGNGLFPVLDQLRNEMKMGGARNFKSWSHFSVEICILTSFIGCFDFPSSDYHTINQRADQSVVSIKADVGSASTSSAIEDKKNGVAVNKTSIEEKVTVNDLRGPVSALDIANPRRVELLVPKKIFSKDRKSGAIRLLFDDLNLLNVLNMDPVTEDAVSSMPEWMTSLNGKAVHIRGFMLPTYQAEDLERFVLLRDNQECCYGPSAKIYDHILVEMKQGTTANYVPLQQSLEVVGRFKIDLQSANGTIFGLYVIEDATVIKR